MGGATDHTSAIIGQLHEGRGHEEKNPIAVTSTACGSTGEKDSAATSAGDGGRAANSSAERRMTRVQAVCAHRMRPQPGNRMEAKSPRNPPMREPRRKAEEKRAIWREEAAERGIEGDNQL